MTDNTMAMLQALAAFGPVRQTDKCIGEMAELTDALLSHRHGEADREAVIDEVADVLITAGQMRLLFGADAVDARIAVKLSRLSRLVADQVARGGR
jgi:NTP pyrophosphatase (non-canonical NTP hydrolase)